MQNLYSLFQEVEKTEPHLLENLPSLKTYCEDAGKTRHDFPFYRGYNSLKWLIYSLREQLSDDELKTLFHLVVREASEVGSEERLFRSIKSFDAVQPYLSRIERPQINELNGKLIEVNGWRVYINETPKNLTSFIFNHDVADVIVFAANGSAGIVFRERDRDGNETGVVENFHIPLMFYQIARQRPKESWALIGNNLIICGGRNQPQYKTSITIDELLEALRDNAI